MTARASGGRNAEPCSKGPESESDRLRRFAKIWSRAIRPATATPMSEGEFEEYLVPLARRLCDALRTVPLDTQPAYEVGQALVAAQCYDAGGLPLTLGVLDAYLVLYCPPNRPMPPDESRARCARLQHALAAGFAHALSERAKGEQESVSREALAARAAAEQALHASEARFRAVFDGAVIGVGVADLNGQVLLVNDAVARMFGRPGEHLLGENVVDWAHPEDIPAAMDVYHELITGQREHFRMEKPYYRGDGSVLWTNLTVTLLRDETGAPQYQLALMEDITEQRRLRDRLRYEATHDELTGLPNRTLFFERLDEAVAAVPGTDGGGGGRTGASGRGAGSDGTGRPDADLAPLPAPGWEALANGRPADARTPEHASVPEQPSVPGRASVPEHAPVPDRASVPDQASLPDRAPVSDRAEAPDHAGAPDRGAGADRGVTPDRGPGAEHAAGTEHGGPFDPAAGTEHGGAAEPAARPDPGGAPAPGRAGPGAPGLGPTVPGTAGADRAGHGPPAERVPGASAAPAADRLGANRPGGAAVHTEADSIPEPPPTPAASATAGAAGGPAGVPGADAPPGAGTRARPGDVADQHGKAPAAPAARDGGATRGAGGASARGSRAAANGAAADERRTAAADRARPRAADPIDPEVVPTSGAAYGPGAGDFAPAADPDALLGPVAAGADPLGPAAVPPGPAGSAADEASYGADPLRPVASPAHEASYGAGARSGADDVPAGPAPHAEHAASAAGGDARFGMCYLDLDGFRAVNDSLGHAVGDHLLIAVAERLQSCVTSPSQLVARPGGDEFFALTVGPTAPSDAVDLAERMLQALAEPVRIKDRDLLVRASIGVASGVRGETTRAAVLRSVDIAMYRAKAAGGNRYEVADAASDARVIARHSLTNGLPAALENGEFFIEYQPLVRLEDGTVRGAEALVRWLHPVHGVLGPDQFIALAENTGLIVPLGRWVLAEAARQARAWRDARQDGEPLRVNVNLSPCQLRYPDLVADTVAVLDDAGLDPSALCLEVTENDLIGADEEALRPLRQLADLGVDIALDDFGTGYSNLAYLRRLPVSTLKLDRSFTLGMQRDPADPVDVKIVEGIVSLAHTLDLAVTVEGVETGSQAEHLRMLGCDTAQGWYYARPGPPDRLHELALTDVAGG